MLKLSFILLIFLYSLNGFPQQQEFAKTDDKGSDLLNEVQEKYKNISDLSADFKKITNGKLDFSGKFFYKQRNKIRFELKNLIIVSDGNTNWNYNKKENKVIITQYDDTDPSALSLEKVLYDYPSKCTATSEIEKGENVLVLIPKNNSGLKFNKVKLWINDDYLINKVLIEDPNSGLIEFELTNYKTNQDIDNSMFSLIPPEGSKVIDLR
jgi:outer membrane lipoprotein-sorting protein